MKLSRPVLSTVIGVITGHCLIGYHTARLGLESNDFCRSCRDEEEVESITHLMCDCPALAKSSYRTLRQFLFTTLGELARIDIGNIIKFIKETGWFPDVS